ncbi:MAG: Ribonuclease BN [Myxococcota bacterium]|nr:Ribonuclease BN [Myxococcota bacterium]
MSNISVTFWGVRGSLPTPGPTTIKYGGNTTCIEMRVGGHLLIFDAGSGIRELGQKLLKEMPITADLFFTHYHWDHLMGFPFFVPAYVPGNNITIHGETKKGLSVKAILDGQMKFPYFPVTIDIMRANMTFKKIKADSEYPVGDGAMVKTCGLNHPFGAMGYRVEYKGSSVCFITDYEHLPNGDPALERFVANAGALIYDAAYTPEEYEKSKKGFGHSTWRHAAELAKRANVQTLYIFHHEPLNTDTIVDSVIENARTVFPNTEASREGLTFTV